MYDAKLKASKKISSLVVLRSRLFSLLPPPLNLGLKKKLTVH